MLKLSINNRVAGRFSENTKIKVDAPFHVNTSRNTLTIVYIGDSYATWYAAFITKRQKEYNDAFEAYSVANRVMSLNGKTGAVYILAGRGIALSGNGAFTVHNTMLNTKKSKLIAHNLKSGALEQAKNWIMRYQMCIYHFLNKSLKRSLRNNATGPLGYYYRFMAARARWNAYVYTSCINCNVISSGDAIFITLGYNNNTGEAVAGEIKANIAVKGSHKNLIWYGIFLSETSPLTSSIFSNNTKPSTKKVDYEITRNGAVYYKISDEQYAKLINSEEDKEEKEVELTDEEIKRRETLKARIWLPDVVAADKNNTTNPEDPTGLTELESPTPGFTEVEAPSDITNPNNCVWSRYGGYWGSGLITQTIELGPGECCKNVYSISKHPGVTGYTKRSESVSFNVTITYNVNDIEITRTYTDIPCYMQDYANEDEVISNNGDPKRYILVASSEMGGLLPADTSSTTK
jgi:hypothetical protein